MNKVVYLDPQVAETNFHCSIEAIVRELQNLI